LFGEGAKEVGKRVGTGKKGKGGGKSGHAAKRATGVEGTESGGKRKTMTRLGRGKA